MRRLHATGLRERFVASGVYQLPDGVQEFWSIHEVGAGAHFIRVDRDGRASQKASLLQEALRNARGFLERIDQQLYDLDQRPVARMRCTRFSDHVEISLKDRSGRLDEIVAMDGDFLIVPPGIMLDGLSLARASRMAQVVHGLQLSLDGDSFKWQCCSIATRCGQPEWLHSGSNSYLARPCAWEKGTRRSWLDEHDIVLRCEDGRYSVDLANYARQHD